MLRILISKHSRASVALQTTRGVFVAAALAVAPSSSAADPTPNERARADQLFAEGRKLMAEGKYDEACPKLAQSQQLDPGGGTILNLALCHEGQGLHATAWVEFGEALRSARKDGRRDREKMATEFLAAVEPKVSHLIFQVKQPADTPGLVVRLDDTEIARNEWQNPVAVDPGAHRITFRAPGKVTREVRIAVNATGDYQTVVFPTLLDSRTSGLPQPERSSPPSSEQPLPPESDVVTSGASPPSDSASSSGGTMRTIGLIALGVGVVAVGAGTVVGLEAISKREQSDTYCSENVCADHRGVMLNDDARRLALYADVAFGTALVAGAVGAYLTISSMSSGSSSSSASRGPAHGRAMRIAPSLGPGSAGVGVVASW